MEALVSPSLEDEIFLGWTIPRDLISGPIYGTQLPTPNAKAKPKNDMEPKSLHNHTKITWTWAPRRNNEYHTPTKSCPGCGATRELFQYRESCPNKNNICYHCGKLGHIREVCRTIKQQQAAKDDRQRPDPRPSDMAAWSKTYPLPTSEFKGMSMIQFSQHSEMISFLMF